MMMILQTILAMINPIAMILIALAVLQRAKPSLWQR